MKKILLAFGMFLALMVTTSASVFAAATVPSTSVWFTPATAAAGDAINLNALVYNNQSFDATVTVAFTFDKGTVVGTAKEIIPSQTAKTVSVPWKMPVQSTIVTAAVTSAVTKSNAAIPALAGTLGTMTVSTNAVTPIISGTSFPGSAQIGAWLTPLLAKIEAFRVNEAAYYTTLSNTSKAEVGSTLVSAPTVALQNGISSKMLGNPMEYLTYAFAASCAALFSSVALFYIALILITLLVLRFVINLIF